MKEDEMGGVCSTLGEKLDMHTEFWSEYMKKRDHLGDLDGAGE
jgi:hypothetical protein